MNLLFIYPEFTRRRRYADWLEIGVAAALLRRIGWGVEGFYWKSPRLTRALERRCEELVPELVATSIHPDQVAPALEINRRIKANRPQTLTIACGLWPTLAPHAAIESRAFDALVLAEWEHPLATFAAAFDQQRDYHKIANIWVRERPVEIGRLPIRPPVELEALPPPDRDLFPYAQILQINGGVLPIQASRACQFQCGFCPEPVRSAIQQAGPQAHRVRPPGDVVAEAADLVHVFAPRRLLFVDPLFPWDVAWLDEFADRWAAQVQLPFAATVAVETATPAVLDRLRRAGCDRVVLGLETGDETLRHSVANRNLSNQAIREFRQALAARDMELTTTNMLGLPGETPETLEATLRFNRELEPASIDGTVFDPLPHTPLAHRIEKEKIELEDRTDATRDPDISRLRQPALPQKTISRAYDRLCLLDSVLRASRARLHPPGQGYFDAMAHFAEGKFRSPWRRAARLVEWRHGSETREVLALRAPTEITFDFVAKPFSALAFGVAAEPVLRGLRAHQTIQFSIKVAQDNRTYRLFKKFLVPALDPDARRWHDYLFPLREVRPGPCRLVFQLRIEESELAALGPDEEIWGGWSRPHVVDRYPTAQGTPLPMHGGDERAGGAMLFHSALPSEQPPSEPASSLPKPAPDESAIVLPTREVADDVSPGVEAGVASASRPEGDPEKEALHHHIAELDGRMQVLEARVMVAEAEKMAALRRAQEAETRAARIEAAFQALGAQGRPPPLDPPPHQPR